MRTKCETCRFWDRRDESRAGHCRVESPTLLPNSSAMGHWPVTNESDWCGEAEPEVEAKQEKNPKTRRPT
jgi:hypothetical protein